MLQPELVAECVQAMREAVDIPVTVKTRIGVDHEDTYPFLLNFINTVKRAGCRTFIVHARKAWLNGLSPKQNRTIPPLDYERVYRLKRDHPELEIIINGGISDSAAVASHLNAVDGVMIGREACRHITWLHELERLYFTSAGANLDCINVLHAYFDYIEPFCKAGASLQQMIKPCLSVSIGVSGARELRRRMCEDARRGMDGLDNIRSWIGDFFHDP